MCIQFGALCERLVAQGEIIGARLVPDDQINLDGDYKQGQLRFDDGGMRGLACGLCWCGLVHFVASLPEDVCVHPSVVELARSLLHLPTCFKSAASDESSNMIKRIIRQNVDSKKLPVSSFEWSQILASLRKNGKQLSVAEAIDLYNANPEVQAHGGASSKDCVGIRFRSFLFISLRVVNGSVEAGHPVVSFTCRTNPAPEASTWTARNSMP